MIDQSLSCNPNLSNNVAVHMSTCETFTCDLLVSHVKRLLATRIHKNYCDHDAGLHIEVSMNHTSVFKGVANQMLSAASKP